MVQSTGCREGPWLCISADPLPVAFPLPLFCFMCRLEEIIVSFLMDMITYRYLANNMLVLSTQLMVGGGILCVNIIVS